MICSSDSAMEWELKLYQKPGPRSFLLNLFFELWCHIQFCIQRQTTLSTNSGACCHQTEVILSWTCLDDDLNQESVFLFYCFCLWLCKALPDYLWATLPAYFPAFTFEYSRIFSLFIPSPNRYFFSFSYFTCDKHIAICINLERRRILI